MKPRRVLARRSGASRPLHLPVTAGPRFRLLGPLRVRDGAAWVPVRAAQQRLVLAILLIEAGRTVTADRLVAEIWGGHPPRAAASVLRGYVMRLRRQLGGSGAPLLTRDGGYELAVDEGCLDTGVFDRLGGAARRALAAGDLTRGVARLSQALELWRGEPLDDVPASPTVTPYRTRLAQSRLAATEDWLGAELACGNHGEVVTELARLAAAHPMRERLCGQLMLALYRCGRRGEALDAYRRAHTALADGMGLAPGQPLRDLHHAIVSGDPLRAGQGSPGPAGWWEPARGDMPPAGPRQPGAGRPAAGLPVPSQLPADLAGFSGRDEHLRRLDRLLPSPGGRRPAAVVISALEGTGGIGKTTLAVHWAHRTADRFPDGQLYVNLRGFGGHGGTAGPVMEPAEVIRGFLDVLVPPRRIPVSPQAQAGLYRSLLAGRRMLILLDNARDADQVRPLLPSSPGCLVLVTSRNQLTGLVATDGAQPLAVELLSRTEARELLARRLGQDRLAAEPAAVDEVIDRCAGLPLALAIVAARASIRPVPGLAALARELRHGLDGLASGEESADVRAVFSWSYRALSPGGQRLFRLLALHPGREIAVPVAASLAGVDLATAVRSLSELARAHLVNEPVAGRYAWHDLLRAYATELVGTVDTGADRQAARHRMLDSYLHSGHAAARLLEPHRGPLSLDPARPGVAVTPLADQPGAHDWFDIERHNLLAAARDAAGTGFDTHAWQLPWTMASYLDLRGHWQDLVTAQTGAAAAGVRLGNRRAQIKALNSLAGAYVQLGRFDDAHAQLARAVALSDEVGDHVVQAHTRGNVGMALQSQHRDGEAIGYYQQALDIYRDAGDLLGQARALNSIGWSRAMLGQHAQALDDCRASLALAVEVGARPMQGTAWDSIGVAHHHLGDHHQAADCFDRALALHREHGDRYYEAETLTHLGDNWQALGNPDAARAAWRQALSIFEDLDHPDAGGVRRRLRS